MKVAYIIHAMDPLAGANKALFSLLAELQCHGIEPYIVVPTEGTIPSHWQDIAAQVIQLNYRPCTYPPIRNFRDALLFPLRTVGRAILAYKASYQLAQIIRTEHIDLVHSNTSVLSIGRDAAKIANIPHIYHFREYGDVGLEFHYMPTWRLYHRWTKSSLNICITKGVQMHHFPEEQSRSTVIYDGVMPSQQQPSTWDTPHSYFMAAGRVEKSKNFDFLLQGYALYKQATTTPLPLKIVGRQNDPVYLQSLQSFITQNGLEDHVEWLGERSDMPQLLRQATATIISSEFEGFGFVMAEAMFNGCLVIGRNTAGTKEQFDNGLRLSQQEIGLRYDTPRALAQCMLRAEKASVSEWTAMKQCAFQIVNSLYITEEQTKQILDIYQQVTTS